MNEKELALSAVSNEFVEEVRRAGIDVNACFQCGRCSAGCPVAEFYDLTPMEVVRLSAYGFEDELLHARTIWICASCETCTTRCPNSIDIAGLMDLLRERALKRGILPAESDIVAFHKAFLNTVQRYGRTYELGMIGEYKLRSGDLFGDMKLGLAMMARGKLHFLPKSIQGRKDVKKIFKDSQKETSE